MGIQLEGMLLVLILATLWAIIGVLQSDASREKKALWIALVSLLPGVGLLIWYYVGPRDRMLKISL